VTALGLFLDAAVGVGGVRVVCELMAGFLWWLEERELELEVAVSLLDDVSPAVAGALVVALALSLCGVVDR